MRRDPRHHVLPGQPLRLAAEQVNALNKMMRVNAGATGGPVGIPEQAKNIILCRNDSGSDVARWGVLEISGVVFDPSSGSDAEATFTSTPCVTGVTPTDGAKPFVIAVEPIASGVIGRVAVAGVVQCKLDVAAAGDSTAGGKAGSRDELKTGSGSARVLWKQGGTGGDKWGLVAIGGGGDHVRLCKTTAVWERDTIATLDVWEDGTPPSESQTTGQTVEAVNKMYRVASATWVIVARCTNGKWYLVEAGDNHSEGCVPPSIGGRDLTDLPGYDAAKTQALGHESGCLKWIDIEDCQTETTA